MSSPVPVPLRRRLGEERVLAIVRGSDPDAALHSVRVLADAGIPLIEVSLTTPGAFAVLTRARQEVDAPLTLGAGTVVEAQDARRAVEAGAAFLVTPGQAPAVAAATEMRVDVLAGAFTPSEVIAARRADPAAIKVFPAGALGPGYLRALREPFPDALLVPVGGVAAEDAAAYFEAGALAIGVGSTLVGDAARTGGDLEALRARARALRAAVERCR